MTTDRRKLLAAMGALGAVGVMAPWAMAASKIKPGSKSVLIAVDVQNCFVEGGTLPVAKGSEVVPVINRISTAFENIVVTQDWHTKGHASFASAYDGKKPFETTKLSYGTQVLWPDHCVQGTSGADFHPDLNVDVARLILRKGTDPRIDSYSAFQENDRRTTTGLEGWLRAVGVGQVTLVGLATDVCVRFSALDAARAGFDVTVGEAAARGLSEASVISAWHEMQSAGVRRWSGVSPPTSG